MALTQSTPPPGEHAPQFENLWARGKPLPGIEPRSSDTILTELPHVLQLNPVYCTVRPANVVTLLRNFGIVEICRDVERGLTCNEGKLLPLPIISSTCIYSIVAKEVLTLSKKPLPFLRGSSLQG
jgi:hypothetical protein